MRAIDHHAHIHTRCMFVVTVGWLVGFMAKWLTFVAEDEEMK